ncbi:glycosyltransferase family 4 protein [Chromohalobacter sp. 296-RDG]|uniref:glycosyltransferase family 4 protein n=1 Tax=Chromohalobacter sp. 296-RDG TaxID=2994062 RepID=UPI0024698420|nr:glycosyltransferase family 4 protein [Chromohalobacter sp. 296-RDG]
MIVNVTHTFGPGSTPGLVAEIHKGLMRNGIESYWIALNGDADQNTIPNTYSCGSRSPRNPFLILILHNIIKNIQEKQNRKAIVHSHLTWPLYYTAIATLGLNVRRFYTEHSTFNRRRSMPFLNPIERYIYKKQDIVVAISNGVKKSLKSWLKERRNGYEYIKIINNGAKNFQHKSYLNDSLEKRLRLVSIGRLVKHKGLDSAIKGVALAKDKVYEYRIYGDGSERAQLEKLSKEYKVDDIVKYMGATNQVEEVLLNSDAFVMPSRWEGFGLSAVEAMSTGIPIIASNVPGLSDVLGPDRSNVYRVSIDCPDCIRKGIEFIYYNYRELEDISIENVEQASKFSIDEMVKNYTDLYREYLNIPTET